MHPHRCAAECQSLPEFTSFPLFTLSIKSDVWALKSMGGHCVRAASLGAVVLHPLRYSEMESFLNHWKGQSSREKSTWKNTSVLVLSFNISELSAKAVPICFCSSCLLTLPITASFILSQQNFSKSVCVLQMYELAQEH